MFAHDLYIAVTGIKFYYGARPFQLNAPLILKKEPDNAHDGEAIAVIHPLFGPVGYVANSPYTTVTGCLSAGRLYDKIPDECVAMVRVIADGTVIAQVLPEKKLDVRIDLNLRDQRVTGIDPIATYPETR